MSRSRDMPHQDGPHRVMGDEQALARNLSRVERLTEKLAALEHEQWITWADSLMKNEPSLTKDRRERWNSLMISYKLLTEAQKDQDRKWALKVMEVIEKDVQEHGPL